MMGIQRPASLLKLVPALLFAVCSSTAQADWTFLNDNGGDGSLVGAVPSFTLYGSDNGTELEPVDSAAIYYQVFDSATTLSFTWTYVSQDCCGSYWDPAGYLLNGNFVQLSTDVEGGPGDGNGSGMTTVAIAANDSFGWYVYSPDSLDGRAMLTVTVIPEPSTALMAASGLALLLVRRRHVRRA